MYLSGWQTIWHNWQIKEKTKEVPPMSKMAELDAAVAELRKCGETLAPFAMTSSIVARAAKPSTSQKLK